MEKIKPTDSITIGRMDCESKQQSAETRKQTQYEPSTSVEATNDGGERVQRFGEGQVHRLPEFSWCEDVRRVEDLFNRPDVPEPIIRGKDNGIPNRVQRLKALGNSVVPIQGYTAWKMLTNELRDVNDKE